MCCLKFSIIDELLADFWCKIGTWGYLGWVLQSQGSMSVSPRCNVHSYPVFVSDTHPMSYPKFSIVDEFLTEFWCKIGTQGYLGRLVPLQGSIPLGTRCNTHSHPIYVSANRSMSCPKFNIIDKLLTDFWGKMDTQGYLGWVVPSQVSMPLLPRCETNSYPVFVSCHSPYVLPKIQHYRWTFDRVLM